MRIWQSELPRPMIYAFTTPDRPNQVKVGETSRDVDVRIQEILRQAVPDPTSYTVLIRESAIIEGRGVIKDHDVHRVLENHLEKHRYKGTEWFDCSQADVAAAIDSLKTGERLSPGRIHRFDMRPEQKEAVNRAANYFRRHASRRGDLKFLWNAKMRFGKTFTTYKLAQEMGWTKILILTYKPAVEDSWRQDLNSHHDFDGWTFIGNHERDPHLDTPTVRFSSFQSIYAGDGDRLQELYETAWDAIVLDEYHFGAWRDSARELYVEDPSLIGGLDLQSRFLAGGTGIVSDHVLHLSGTPFRALQTGEFTEDQIFNWTYTDEQRAKAHYQHTERGNPYDNLPRMVMMTYKLPAGILDNSDGGELNLDAFFKAEKIVDGENSVHVFRDDRQIRLWLDFISRNATSRSHLQEDEKSRSPMPYADPDIWPYINHTLWYLPSVSSCHAMADLIRQHSTLNNYEVVVCAGAEAGIGADALRPVRDAIASNRKTITLTCGKLTTGVTVPEWTAVFMLRNMKSPESYFQTAFRVQSPGLVNVGTGKKVKTFPKDVSYVFDFHPQRALTLASQYCYQLDEDKSGGEASKKGLNERMQEFLNYLPVLCHDNGVMLELDANAAIELATSGIGTAMLARRFQSHRMVEISYATIGRIQEDLDLVLALQQIEAFRNLNRDMELVQSELKKKGYSDDTVNDGANEEKSTEKKSKIDPEVRKLMKEIKDNLLKFITRLPVFMYLNDEREKTALEVICTTDEALFRKVTGINKGDFRKLMDMGVFNAGFMNETIRAFKQVEDNALVYLGDRVIDGTFVAAWNTHVERS
jgi:hypothetical protein